MSCEKRSWTGEEARNVCMSVWTGDPNNPNTRMWQPYTVEVYGVVPSTTPWPTIPYVPDAGTTLTISPAIEQTTDCEDRARDLLQQIWYCLSGLVEDIPVTIKNLFGDGEVDRKSLQTMAKTLLFALGEIDEDGDVVV